jgi:NADPH:quinone reductase-like Zn-dependent oxidoreductase
MVAMSNAVPDKKILVTGSTGATGTPTVKLLIERGFAVRAQVRRQDHRSATLESLGAEIVEGDLLNLSNVREMLAGVHSAFFIFPMRPDFLDATSYFAQAAAEAKLDAIVNLSQRTASDTSESHSTQSLDVRTGIRPVPHPHSPSAANVLRGLVSLLHRHGQSWRPTVPVRYRQQARRPHPTRSGPRRRGRAR